jgi:hypothetical protein
MSVYENLEKMGVVLPKMTPPVAAFAPWVRADNLLYVSGHIARKDGRPGSANSGQRPRPRKVARRPANAAIDLLAPSKRQLATRLAQTYVIHV